MIISDSTSLIILFDLERLELLSNIFKKIYIPKAVYEEISFKEDIMLPKFIKIAEVKNSELLNSLKNLLDVGESEAIALAKMKNLPIIIDEKEGRKIAKNLDLKIIGLLGIVYLNVKSDFLSKDEAAKFLTSAVDNGYRISKKLIDDMMESL